MSYNIFYSTKSEKQLKKLDKQTKIQILKKVAQLGKNPYLGKPLRNVFKNYCGLHIGKYRVLYLIRGKDIVIAKVEHRKKAYD